MPIRAWIITAAAIFFVTSCSGREPASEASAAQATETAEAAVDLGAAPSGSYRLDPRHGYIVFTYNHQGYSKPFLRWGRWDAVLDWDAENPETSSVTATIDVRSIDSGVEEFDGHLQGPDFFNAENFPEIAFVSKEITRTAANAGELTGELTIKGITKPVVLDVTFNNAGEGSNGAHKIGFSARGTVKRSDFGVDKYVPFVSDTVDFIIEAEFVSVQSAE